MRRIFRELLMTAGAVAILFIVLAAADDRVREQLTGRAGGRSSAQVVSVMTQMRGSASAVAAIARAESRAHTPMLIFTVAATILVVFMLRT
jgi:hypothetical protein